MTRALQIRAWGHQQMPGGQGKNNSVLQEGSNTSPAATRTKRPTLDKTHPKLHVCLKRNLPTHSNLPQFYTVDYFCCINKGLQQNAPTGLHAAHHPQTKINHHLVTCPPNKGQLTRF